MNVTALSFDAEVVAFLVGFLVCGLLTGFIGRWADLLTRHIER